MGSRRLTLAVASFSILLSAAGAPTLSAGQRASCAGHRATIVGTPGRDHLVGTAHRDVVVTLAGNDTIIGKGGRDAICAGKGNDVLKGGRGRDYLDSGLGDDRANGGPGGRDIVIGGFGADRLNGGSGSRDLVRGDGTPDKLDGGPGAHDIVSFSLTSTAFASLTVGERISLGEPGGAGHASGPDGDHERLRRFEDAIGSGGSDRIVGNDLNNRIDGGPGEDFVFGNHAAGGADHQLVPEQGHDIAFGGSDFDRCLSFESRDSCEASDFATPPSFPLQGPPPPRYASSVELSRGLGRDTLVIGSGVLPSHVSLTRRRGTYVISDPGGVEVFGTGCGASSESVVRCNPPQPLAGVVVGFGRLDDSLAVHGRIPIIADGSYGDDTLAGGAADDVLDGGLGGNDTLAGGGGTDALVAGVDVKDHRLGPDRDNVNGGRGTDLLLAGNPCDGDRLNGGPGADTVSFARTHEGVIARLGGLARNPSSPSCRPAKLISDESLEGSNSDDRLIGDGHANSMLGHRGADAFYAKGGRDVIDAQDGERDRLIDCGAGHDNAKRDGADPRPRSC